MSFWGLCAIGCCLFSLDLPNQTVFVFLPPKGTESDTAYNKMNEYFPDFVFIDVEVIVIEAKWDVIELNKTLIQNNKTQTFVKTINDTLWNDINPKYNLLLTIQSYYDTSNVTDLTNITNPKTNETYPIDLQKIIDSAMSPKYIDPEGNVMLIYVESNINRANTETLNSFIGDIKDALSSITDDEYSEYDAVLTGGITIFQQSMQVIADDITSKDLMTLPVIFGIMIYMIGSWKLVGLPGTALGMTIVISFGIMYPFAVNYIELNPMGPSIMMFLSMALSIDYSMFLLSRFAAERKAGKSVDDAVREMLRYSAHVVMLSGTILIICYMALVIFPVSGMETVAYGAAISIFLCMIINISMSASAILAFPNFYGKLETFPSCLIRCCAKIWICCPICYKYKTYGLDVNDNETLLTINENDEDEYNDNHNNISSISKPRESVKSSMLGIAATSTAYSDVLVGNGKVSVSNPNANDMRLLSSMSGAAVNGFVDDEDEEWDFKRTTKEEQDIEVNENCYFKLTQYTTRWPYKCIIPMIVYSLMIPGIYELMQMEFSIDFTMNFPKHVSSVDAYNVLINEFNPGDMAPFYILIESKDSKQGSIWNENYFNALCAIGMELINDGYENNTQITSIGFVPDIYYGNLSCIQTQAQIVEYKTIINHPKITPIAPYIDTPYWQSYMKWFNQTVNNPQQTVSIILAIPNFNPYTASALENCENYRDSLKSIASRQDIKPFVNVYIHNSLFWEIDSLHEVDKTLPYGLIIIISITFILIGFVFHAVFLPFRLFLCVVVPILFVYGVVTGIYQNGWLNWTSWESVQSTDGIFWMLPVITCTVLVGLALDYEIFLYSRVFEYRSKGYTTSASIILGVSTTGPIISAAGCVMAMAFGGLLLENIIASNQMGMVFVFGVLIDTFIVRPLLVPSILSFADKWNWWPTKMPIPYKNEYHKITT